MNAKHLILTMSLTLSSSAAIATHQHGHADMAKTAPAGKSDIPAIPRVVITAAKPKVRPASVAVEPVPVARLPAKARQFGNTIR